MDGLHTVVPSEQVVLVTGDDWWLSRALGALQAGFHRASLPLSARICPIYIQFYILENIWPEAGGRRPLTLKPAGQTLILKQAPMALFQIQFKYFRAGPPGGLRPRNCLTLTLDIFSVSSQPCEAEQRHSLTLMKSVSSGTVHLN